MPDNYEKTAFEQLNENFVKSLADESDSSVERVRAVYNELSEAVINLNMDKDAKTDQKLS